jgi:hypothetical protein
MSKEIFPCDVFFNLVPDFLNYSEARKHFQLLKVLSELLIASALSLGVGGIFLYVYALVPNILVETTVVAVIILLLISYPVSKGNMLAVNISTILGIIAPIISLATPAHVGVLEQLGKGGLIAFLGVLQLFGFYIFPLAFVLLRIVYHGNLVNPVRSPSKTLVNS